MYFTFGSDNWTWRQAILDRVSGRMGTKGQEAIVSTQNKGKRTSISLGTDTHLSGEVRSGVRNQKQLK